MVAGFGGMQGVTVGHLPSMTSGVPDYLTDDYLDDALDDPERVQTPRVALSHAYGERALSPPGQRFDHSNTNDALAQLIAERVSGENYADLISPEVLRPSGMARAFVFGSAPLPADFPTGHEDRDHIRFHYSQDGFGDGRVIASAADLARFYRALFLDRTLLSAAAMSDLTRDPLGIGYGLGVEVDGPMRGHSGGDLGFSADIRLDLRDGAIAIVLAADAEADTGWTGEVLADR